MSFMKSRKVKSVGVMKNFAIAAVASAIVAAAPAAAEDAAAGDSFMDWPGITGDWGGARQKMEDAGWTFEAVYTGEFDRNFNINTALAADPATQQKNTVYQTNIDVSLTIDTEKAGMWPGGTFFVYGLANSGTDPTYYSGDMQAYSNIESAANQVIVQEAWFQQEFADGMLSLLAGLHDLNSEFYASDYAGLFFNSSFGIGPEMSSTSGNLGVSLFPKAGLGARARIQPVENLYVQAAIYDGDPTTRKLAKAEGKLWIVELGASSETGSYKAGYWQHTADVTFDVNTFASNYGYYAVVDQQLVEFDNGTAIGVFGQWGSSPKARNDIFGYLGGGIHIQGLIPTRGDDEFGFGVARAQFHPDLATASTAETAYEVTYRLALTNWMAVQPSFQWIKNPSGDLTAPTMKVGSLRFEVAL